MASITKQKIHNSLILLIFVCFGSFGSLSHLFSLALIIFSSIAYLQSEKKNEHGVKATILFFVLNSCFFLFLLNGLFYNNFFLLLKSLSPMLPLPLIGLLIIFHHTTDFKLKTKKIALFAQLSILVSFILYLLLYKAIGPNNYFQGYVEGRVSLFSGNPIPFSFVVLGISIFCLTDWRNSSYIGRLGAFVIFLLGAYLAGFSSGTRGTLLALILITPIIILYLSNNLIFTLISILSLTLIGLIILATTELSGWDNQYFFRIKEGLDTIIFLKSNESSVGQRLTMWSASIKAISDALIFGHGITEKFNALKPYLDNSFPNYTHPHNDILAAGISIGVFGIITGFFSLISAFIASLLAPHSSSAKIYFGLMLACPTILTANVSTIIFNDVSSAWFAFSVYLIWSIEFSGNQKMEPKSN